MEKKNNPEQRLQGNAEEKYWPSAPKAERIKNLIRSGRSSVTDLGSLSEDEKDKYDPENPPDDEDPIEYRPYLVIPAFLGDMGYRPLSVPFYLSPSIWVETYQPSGSPGQLVPIPQVGQSYQIAVQIGNRGYAPSYGTVVEFYWGDPSTNVNAGILNPIGGPISIMIQAGTTAIARSGLWVPIWVNNGHECLITRAYDPISDQINPNSFHPHHDRHVGQTNLGLIQASAGTHAYTFVRVHNPTKEELKLRLIIEPLAREAVLQHAERFQVKARLAEHQPLYFGFVIRDWHFKGEPESTPKEEKTGHQVMQAEEHPHPPLPHMVDQQFAKALEPVADIVLQPGESRHIDIVVGIPYAAMLGEIYGLRIAQYEQNCIAGAVDRLILIV